MNTKRSSSYSVQKITALRFALSLSIFLLFFMLENGVSKTSEVFAQVPSCPTSGEIWITKRTDGLSGTGTANDPCDVSTASKFDALMRSFSQNSIVHIGAGVFETTGYHPFNDNVSPGIPTRGWSPKKGWVLTGAGIEQTILKLVGVKDRLGSIVYNSQMYDLVGARYDVIVDDFTLSGMTLDGNLQNIPPSYQVAVGGFSVFGNRMQVNNIKIINFGTYTPLQEAFAFLAGGAKPQTGDIYDLTIDRIEISRPVTSVRETTFLAIGGFDNYLVNNQEYNPTGRGGGFVHNMILRNSIFDGSSSNSQTHGISLMGAVNGLAENNIVRNVTFGIYQDSWRTKSVIFRGNTISNVINGIYFNFDPNPPYRFFDNITIDSNIIELNPIGRSNVTFGIGFGGGKTSRPYNFGSSTVTNNTVRLFQASTTGNTRIWGIGGGSIENLTITNNSIQLDQGYQRFPIFWGPHVSSTTCMGNTGKNMVALSCPGRLWDTSLSATSTPSANGPWNANVQTTLTELLLGAVASNAKFEFDCQNDGVVDITIPESYVSGTTMRTVICSYPQPGTYAVSATTTYQGSPLNKTAAVTVSRITPQLTPPLPPTPISNIKNLPRKKTRWGTWR